MAQRFMVTSFTTYPTRPIRGYQNRTLRQILEEHEILLLNFLSALLTSLGRKAKPLSMTSTQIREEINREVALLPPEEEQQVLDFVRLLRTPKMGSNNYADYNVAVNISKTEGINGGDASIGATRIAVWMLEEVRREGLSDGEILALYPQLDARHLVMAWWYVATQPAEIEFAIQKNEEA